MVATRPQTSCARLFFLRPRCAQVTVTPDVSRINVLIAGIPQAPIGVKVSSMPGPETGHCAEKFGHRCCMVSPPPSHGTDSTRM